MPKKNCINREWTGKKVEFKTYEELVDYLISKIVVDNPSVNVSVLENVKEIMEWVNEIPENGAEKEKRYLAASRLNVSTEILNRALSSKNNYRLNIEVIRKLESESQITILDDRKKADYVFRNIIGKDYYIENLSKESPNAKEEYSHKEDLFDNMFHEAVLFFEKSEPYKCYRLVSEMDTMLYMLDNSNSYIYMYSKLDKSSQKLIHAYIDFLLEVFADNITPLIKDDKQLENIEKLCKENKSIVKKDLAKWRRRFKRFEIEIKAPLLLLYSSCLLELVKLYAIDWQVICFEIANDEERYAYKLMKILLSYNNKEAIEYKELFHLIKICNYLRIMDF